MIRALRGDSWAEPAGAEPRLRRAMLAHLGQDFSAPVGAILGFAEILMEEAPARGFGRFAADLLRIHEAGLTLQQMVAGLLDPGMQAERSNAADEADFVRRLRHDLRTPLNAVIGYGEMLLEDADESGAAPLVEDLRKMLAAAERLLRRVEALSERQLLEAPPVAGAPEQSLGAAGVLRPLLPEAELGRRTGASRILVVDDHESNRDLLSRRLARDGHEVFTAGSGEAALRLADQQVLDLVLLDLLMPGMSGYEVLGRLKADPQRRHLPVIMISALDELDSVARCLEMGAEDYLPKPCDPRVLRARVESSLERKQLRDREQEILEQLRIEKERSDLLLRNILPEAIVARLQAGETAIADRVADATILFADLVGFTDLGSRLPPARLVELLNLLFTEFDRLSQQFGLEKIKTIGDAYMVAGGLLEARPDHAEAAADMALAMLQTVRQTGRRLREPLHLRIGIHCGSVVAGIIGTRKFNYDIWGDAVNTASRLETQGSADRITVSAEIHRRLKDQFAFAESGPIELKGKGMIETYQLVGRRP
jgi:class 3 adenylate cyclase/CheY-like chemotaxis protein